MPVSPIVSRSSLLVTLPPTLTPTGPALAPIPIAVVPCLCEIENEAPPLSLPTATLALEARVMGFHCTPPDVVVPLLVLEMVALAPSRPTPTPRELPVTTLPSASTSWLVRLPTLKFPP